jgi:hypothetical protein
MKYLAILFLIVTLTYAIELETGKIKCFIEFIQKY